MKGFVLLLLALSLIACRKSDQEIDVPNKQNIVPEKILSTLAEKAEEQPNNERLIAQQLYFCQLMNWPEICEKPLKKARKKNGLSEKLTDQFMAYYQRNKQYEKLESLLSNAVKTRKRQEVLISISEDLDALQDYMKRYQDEQALELACKLYLKTNDTLKAFDYMDQLHDLNPENRLLDVYPEMLFRQGRYQKLLKVAKERTPDKKLYRLTARSLYALDSLDSASYVMRQVDSEKAWEYLYRWNLEASRPDSAIKYLNDLLAQHPEQKQYLLAKAQALEAKGYLTSSLPYFEQAYSQDTTDAQILAKLKEVRRKVAYLRRIRKEQERDALEPPQVERKTIGK